MASSRICGAILDTNVPCEDSAKVSMQENGNTKSFLIIDRSTYNEWKRLRYNFYRELKEYTVSVERGLRFVPARNIPHVMEILKRYKARFEELERELWRRLTERGVAHRVRHRQALYPGRNFRWVLIPLSDCSGYGTTTEAEEPVHEATG